MPRIDVSYGLELLAVMKEIEEVYLFDDSIPILSVFCILTDQDNKILHYSDNFLTVFKLSE